MTSTENSSPRYEYQKSLKKSRPTFLTRAIRVNKYLNRPVASLLVRALLHTGVSPNQVTVASFIVGSAGAVFFALGKHENLILGGILIQLASILDCADGMLARARDAGTRYGAYLDILLDRIFEFLLFGGIVAGMIRTNQSMTLIILGLAAVSLYFLEVSLYYMTLNYSGEGQEEGMSELRALMLLLVLVFAVANRLDIAVYVLLSAALINNLYIIVAFLRPIKE